VLDRLGGALVWSPATTPGLTAVHALMTGGARLDLFFEKASAAPAAPRPVAKPLIDKTGLASQLRLDWKAPAPVVAGIIQVIIRMTRQGATWPLRVLGRGQWATLAMMELDLINGQLAQLMAVRHDAASYYRNPFSLAPLLTAAERGLLAQLTADALVALGAKDAAHSGRPRRRGAGRLLGVGRRLSHQRRERGGSPRPDRAILAELKQKRPRLSWERRGRRGREILGEGPQRYCCSRVVRRPAMPWRSIDACQPRNSSLVSE
jgi:hypothetical protein